MTNQTSDRKWGLSPKARRFALPAFAVALIVILVGTLLRGNETGAGPVVGGDLHAVGELGDRMFVGGHGGAGYRAGTGGWSQIDTLDDKDIMGWAQSDAGLLAGGHAGLYRSRDDGSTFEAVPGLPVRDVHALGAAGKRVYVGSPEGGILVSDDGGTTFTQRSTTGQDFMGTIWIDPFNPDVAIAPSMKSGAVKTTDGGASWISMGSSSGAMAVAVDSTGQNLVAIGMDGAETSVDGGATWASVDVPKGASAAAYTSRGELVVAVLLGDRAGVYTEANGTWDLLT